MSGVLVVSALGEAVVVGTLIVSSTLMFRGEWSGTRTPLSGSVLRTPLTPDNPSVCLPGDGRTEGGPPDPQSGRAGREDDGEGSPEGRRRLPETEGTRGRPPKGGLELDLQRFLQPYPEHRLPFVVRVSTLGPQRRSHHLQPNPHASTSNRGLRRDRISG